MLEMLDQIVRNSSGGEMLKYLEQQKIPAEDFVIERFGSEARNIIDSLKNRNIKEIQNGLATLTAEEIGRFRLSGENHQWMYDRYSLQNILEKSGFKNTKFCTAYNSRIPDWQNYFLDTEQNGAVRKPDSLYMEAEK